MRLSTLLQEYISIPQDADTDIKRLVLDSRKVAAGDLFIAIKGTALDGRKYIPNAVAQGAKAIIFSAENAADSISFQEQVPLIPIHDLANKLGSIAARFYANPAKKMFMIGVTGTNGKTSTTHFIGQMLQALGMPCGVIGTLGSGMFGQLGEAGLTTPDPITLQAILQHMQEQGAKAVAMEVSSHSIDQGRVNGIEYQVGIFTNLTQDHLDYHGDMETYAAVKRRFFAELPTQTLIINADDMRGKQWIHELASKKKVYAYSTNAPCANIPTIYTDLIKLGLHGMSAHVHTPWGEGDLLVPLIGQFNLSNILAVITALCVQGFELSAVLQQLSKLTSVPGRMQTLGGNGKPLAVVDYSHTPDSLEKALQALRAHTEGQLICVFGCGGDRDQGKRPLMAKIAENLADRVIVTNDNPRHEEPAFILQQIMQGFIHPERVFVELDRSKAIANSIQLAKAGDCILIAGKGAERYQQLGDEKIPFDDVEQVRRYLG